MSGDVTENVDFEIGHFGLLVPNVLKIVWGEMLRKMSILKEGHFVFRIQTV